MANDAFDHLYPALVQAFVVIIAGYVAGRLGTITVAQSKGISTYVTLFALPALLFRNMCILDFGSVNWMFLLSIFVAKSSVFVLVGVVTGLVVRPRHWGKVGLYGIFATQSNDFALCYPIIVALYRESHPEFINYLYLIAPISVIFLNPLGFMLLEIHKWQATVPSQRTSKLKAVLTVVKGVLLNPIVFMSALGIVGNFLFHRHVPTVIDDILKVLGDSFAATALFYLGVSMVGKIESLQAKSLFAPAMLICAKMLLLPFLAREITVRFLKISHSGTNVTDDLTNYAFLYGTIPTAPAVYLFGMQYGVAVETVGTGLVAGTFLSAPLMFVSVKMMVMTNMLQASYLKLLRTTIFNSSILSVIATVWVLGVLFLSRRYRSIPHQFVVSLTAAQLVLAAGAIMWHFAATAPQWFFYIYFVFFYIGVLACHCWVAMIAVGVSILRVRGLCYVLQVRVWLYFYGFGVPVFLTGVLLMVTRHTGDPKLTPGLALGEKQLIISLCLICINVIITVCSVIVLQRQDKTFLSARSRTTSTNEAGAVAESTNETDQPAQDMTSSQANQNSVVSQQTNQIPCPSGTLSAVAVANDSIASGSIQEEPSSLIQSLDSRRQRRRTFRRKQMLPVRKFCEECEQAQGCGTPVTNIEDIVPFPDRTGTSAPAGSYLSSSLEADTTPLIMPGSGIGEREEDCRLECGTRAGRACAEREIRGCSSLVNAYQTSQFAALDEEEVAIALTRDRYQITRHLVLVLILLVASLIDLFLHLSRLFMESMDGLYVELEFLNCVLTFGKGIITFAVFGLDTETVLSPFIRKIRLLMCGREIELIPWVDLDPVTKQTCQQFVVYHRHTCQKDIVGCRRYLLQTYRKVFTGADLVDWLMDNEMVTNRAQAVIYGRQLLEGRVIEHVHRERHFSDLPYVYQFVEQSPESNGEEQPSTISPST